jgi:hypothetical protein
MVNKPTHDLTAATGTAAFFAEGVASTGGSVTYGKAVLDNVSLHASSMTSYKRG